jgi:hypothetical protein
MLRYTYTESSFFTFRVKIQMRWWKSTPPMLSHSNLRSFLCSHTQKGGLLGIWTAMFGYRTDLCFHTSLRVRYLARAKHNNSYIFPRMQHIRRNVTAIIRQHSIEFDGQLKTSYHEIWYVTDLKKTNLMHNLCSVYFVKHLYMFWAYLQPIISRYTVWIQQLVLTVPFRRLGWNWTMDYR